MTLEEEIRQEPDWYFHIIWYNVKVNNVKVNKP